MPPAPHHLVVAADDRTGALEVAGACASSSGLPAAVVPAPGPGGGDPWPATAVTVVDLASRHLTPAAAGAAAAGIDAPGTSGGTAPVALHKIDSTLRGNWAHELVARGRRRRARVLLVPALPALGRTCVDGEVREHGRPVTAMTGASDPRSVVGSSRPADHLRGAGAGAVANVVPGAALGAWLDRPDPGTAWGDGEHWVAVCDAADDDDLAAVAAAWAVRSADVLLAGTSATVAAGVLALASGGGGVRPVPVLARPWLVVAGSLHRASAAQVERLGEHGATSVQLDPAAPAATHRAAVESAVEAAGASGVVVVSCAPPRSPEVSPGDADAAAAALARAAAHALGRHRFRTLVVLGGDTAAAVLGLRVVEVGGTVAPGVPWGRVGRGDPLGTADADLVLVTKAGAFGDPDTLARLLPDPTGPQPTDPERTAR